MASREEARQLYVGGLPPGITKGRLVKLFSRIDETVKICLKENRYDKMGRPNPYAFVTFSTHENAERARQELNHTKIKGASICLSWCDRTTNSIRKTNIGNLWVNGLDRSVDNAQLDRIFSDFGEILMSKIVRDDQGNSLGYGYVQFMDPRDAELAMQELNGTMINGMAVRIEPFCKHDPDDTYTNVFIKNLPDTVVDQESFLNLILAAWPDAEENICDTVETPQPCLMLGDDGMPKNFGFCQMKDHESALMLVEKLNGFLFADKIIVANRAKPRTERQREVAQAFVERKKAEYMMSKGRNLYVRGFDGGFTDEDLRSFFNRFGEIESAHVQMTENKRGEIVSKMFGFICFKSNQDAEKCIEESCLLVFDNGEQVYVSYFKPADERRRKLSHNLSRERLKAAIQARFCHGSEKIAKLSGLSDDQCWKLLSNQELLNLWLERQGDESVPASWMPSKEIPTMRRPAKTVPCGAMAEASPRDLIRMEIEARFGHDRQKIAMLESLSDKQCQRLVNEGMLNMWLEYQ